ncbi:hypothetical protein M9H77_36766 [Catharanthus roseus]|uniref:Uncharacterized protein n=1 Tax=Catharanthus roseus TaxID=4058 RepID=A0ACB9ZU31_CATRO|nr:hypothetical protein M9H77_36766 [Catharanthus roseus]
MSLCPPRVTTWGERRKERDGVSLAFGIAGPSGRLARRATSSLVERAPNNCVVVPGLSAPGFSTQSPPVPFRSQSHLPSYLSHTHVPYEVYGSAHPPSHPPDTVYDPYLHVPTIRPHIPYRSAAQESLKEFNGQSRQIGVEFFYQMVCAAQQDSSYSTLGYTTIAYGVSSSEPYIERHSIDRGFEGDKGLGEEHDRVRSLHIKGEADERVDDDGDGDGDSDDAGDEEQSVPVAPASGFDVRPRRGKGKGLTGRSRNKRPDVAREVPAPTQRRKKVKASD